MVLDEDVTIRLCTVRKIEQGNPREAARELRIPLADRREDGLRAVPPDAERETVTVE